MAKITNHIIRSQINDKSSQSNQCTGGSSPETRGYREGLFITCRTCSDLSLGSPDVQVWTIVKCAHMCRWWQSLVQQHGSRWGQITEVFWICWHYYASSRVELGRGQWDVFRLLTSWTPSSPHHQINRFCLHYDY